MEQTAGWTAEPYEVDAAHRLEAELGVAPATAAILARRGLGDPAAARAFLAPPPSGSRPELPGTDAACELILAHVGRGSPIVVFGDYDVDGVCSTALMVEALRALGARPSWRLPSRQEGYGLSGDAVREIAASGAGLLVTVDCGITSVAEVALARELGLDVVVSDHHRPGPVLPECPIVHPVLGAERSAPSDELCAAAVVHALAGSLHRRAGTEAGAVRSGLDLAGLATVCDMVPLVGENRALARDGLAALARTTRPGLRALLEVSALEPAELDARAAGFRLGPRLNAAGRIGRADAALELLLTEDPARATEIARELDGLNHDRRETEQRILAEADRAARDQVHAGAIVVAGEGWHPGVVGIVASRLVERHHRPCVVIALDGQGSGRGSGRSIPAYDLHAGIEAGAEHLERFGGHRMAAGLELREREVGALRAAPASHAGARLALADLTPVQRADAIVSAGDLDLDLAEELERLGPFGAANPEPVLLVPAGRVEHVTAMGEEGAHARFSLASGGARARGVAFRTSQRSLSAAGGAPHDVGVVLERNRYRGTTEARMVLRSLAPTRRGEVVDVGAGDFWDEVRQGFEADPREWWTSAVPRLPGAALRLSCDRRGRGFAAVLAELLASGDRVLVVVASPSRRRTGLEGLAGPCDGPLAVTGWAALGARPELAAEYRHLLVLDPPPVSGEGATLSSAPGEGTVHLAWGRAECDFAAAHWRSQLELRPALVELWRELAGGALRGEALRRALCGAGVHPREARHAGVLLRVLAELGLAEVALEGRDVRAVSGVRVELERSAVVRGASERLDRCQRWLAGPAMGAGAPAVARAG